MGYTHYWSQTRSFTQDEWTDMQEHVREILSYVENMLGVPLANSMGYKGTRPGLFSGRFAFNGSGEDRHESFVISRVRSRETDGEFCKTARKPYDVAVTACLCYLSSVYDGMFRVTSNGSGHDFLLGLDAARKALPNKANILDIPMGVLEDDRWTGPFVRVTHPAYKVQFCINGRGYVTEVETGQVYSAPREELARYLEDHKVATFQTGGKTVFGSYGRQEPDLWSPSGGFDPARHERIGRAQAKVLAPLFPPDAAHSEPPPAYVRPGDMVRPEKNGSFCYSLGDLVQSLAV